MTYADNLLCAEKAFKRGGYFLQNVFKSPKKIVSGEDCLSLMNTYGIPPREVYLIAISHGFAIDVPGFIRLLEEQKEKMKRSRLCSSHSSLT